MSARWGHQFLKRILTRDEKNHTTNAVIDESNERSYWPSSISFIWQHEETDNNHANKRIRNSMTGKPLAFFSYLVLIVGIRELSDSSSVVPVNKSKMSGRVNATFKNGLNGTC
jgi:hypothetical protein